MTPKFLILKTLILSSQWMPPTDKEFWTNDSISKHGTRTKVACVVVYIYFCICLPLWQMDHPPVWSQKKQCLYNLYRERGIVTYIFFHKTWVLSPFSCISVCIYRKKKKTHPFDWDWMVAGGISVSARMKTPFIFNPQKAFSLIDSQPWKFKLAVSEKMTTWFLIGSANYLVMKRWTLENGHRSYQLLGAEEMDLGHRSYMG